MGSPRNTHARSRPLLELTSFELGERRFTVDDVFDAANFCGELENFWKEYLQCLASEAAAEAAGLKAPRKEIQGRSEEYRYAHDLVTAEETDAWLGQRGISQDVFEEYFIRRHWLDQRDLASEPRFRPLSTAAPEEYEAFRAYTLLSGAFEGMAGRLAQREAIRSSSSADDSADQEIVREQRENFETRRKDIRESVAEWLESMERGQEWLEDQITLEAMFSQRCRQNLSPVRLRQTLSALRLPLLMFDYEVMEVDTIDTAREAYLSITLDGLDMEELAHEHRLPYHRSRSYLERVPESLQQSFISSSPGDLIEPKGGQLKLIRINAKTEPSLDDPKINEYIHRRILKEFLSDLEARHVRWLLK